MNGEDRPTWWLPADFPPPPPPSTGVRDPEAGAKIIAKAVEDATAAFVTAIGEMWRTVEQLVSAGFAQLNTFLDKLRVIHDQDVPRFHEQWPTCPFCPQERKPDHE